MILYVNTEAQSPQSSLIVGREDRRPENPRDFVVGDLLSLTIYLVDGSGNFDARSGAAGNTLRVAIGVTANVVAYQNSWTPIANGWAGVLNLNTAEARAMLGAADKVPCLFEIELTESVGSVTTLVQSPAYLLNEMLPENSPAQVPAETFTPDSALRLGYVQNRSGVTGLTGGGTNLDGISTADLGVGIVVALTLSNVVYFYQLQAGSDAEASPQIIRPDDFSLASNSKVWRLVSQLGAALSNGHTHAQNSPASVWTVVHNFGYRPAGISVWVTHAGIEKLADCEISHVSNNSFTVKHRTNLTGTVRCI